MRYTRWVVGAVAAGVGGAAVLAWPPAPDARPSAPEPPEREPELPVVAAGVELHRIPRGPDPDRRWSREPRELVAGVAPAPTVWGAIAQQGLSRRGDSDPRLIDVLSGLSRVGLGPATAAGWGAALDPWVAVALVDLERQIARRCAAQGGQGCWDRALASERSVAVSDPAAEWAIAAFAVHDRELGSPEDRCAAQGEWLARGDGPSIELVGEPCPDHLESMRARLDREVPTDFDGWARFAAVASAASAPAPMDRAVRALEEAARGPRQRELAAYWRARAVGAGWTAPRDASEALVAGVVACAPDGPLDVELDVRGDRSGWVLDGAEAWLPCAAGAAPAPSVPFAARVRWVRAGG